MLLEVGTAWGDRLRDVVEHRSDLEPYWRQIKAPWRRLGRMLGRLGDVLGAPWEHLKAVLKRAGSEKPNPRQGSQIGALGESWRKAALEARGRILDRGRSFQHLGGIRIL